VFSLKLVLFCPKASWGEVDPNLWTEKLIR